MCKRALLVSVALLAGCAGDGAPRADPPPPGDVGDQCVEQWNAPANRGNQAAVARGDEQWRVTVSRWVVDHPAENLAGDGCAYFFFTDERWMSFSGAWEKDGDLRWDVPPPLHGPRMPEQSIQPPNAVVADDGTLE